MKAQIIKTTKQFTGDVFYNVEVDGKHITNSTTMKLEEAEATLLKCHLYKEEQKEVVKEIDL
jgi:hypothetical protein